MCATHPLITTLTFLEGFCPDFVPMSSSQMRVSFSNHRYSTTGRWLGVDIAFSQLWTSNDQREKSQDKLGMFAAVSLHRCYCCCFVLIINHMRSVDVTWMQKYCFIHKVPQPTEVYSVQPTKFLLRSSVEASHVIAKSETKQGRQRKWLDNNIVKNNFITCDEGGKGTAKDKGYCDSVLMMKTVKSRVYVLVGDVNQRMQKFVCSRKMWTRNVITSERTDILDIITFS